MTKSEFETFSTLLLDQLKGKSKEALITIDKNNKLVEQCLGNTDSDDMKKFINDLNNVIVEGKVKSYDIFKKALQHPSFSHVLTSFRNSDVLIRACKALNKDAVKWLLTMDINYDVQDEYGATAFMEAAYRPSMDFLLKKLIKENVDVNKVDYNGNNALFYATKSLEIFKKLYKTGIDVNRVNNEGESLLTYCCKMDRVRTLEFIRKELSLDPNHMNCVGKTACMHLVENAQNVILKSFIKEYNIDPNFKNKFGDTLVSIFIKSYYQHCIGNLKDGSKLLTRHGHNMTQRYAETLQTLIECHCDFNVPVDDDGNTPMMVLLMMKDYVSCQYLLSKYSDGIDLSKENYHGINASYLSLFITNEVFDELYSSDYVYKDKFSSCDLKNLFMNNKSFDKKYLENGDITVVDTMKVTNNYPTKLEYNKIVQLWLMESLFPNAVKVNLLVPYSNEDPNSFGSIMTKHMTGGLLI